MKIRAITLFQGQDKDHFKDCFKKIADLQEENKIYTLRASLQSDDEDLLEFVRLSSWGYTRSVNLSNLNKNVCNDILRHIDDDKCFTNVVIDKDEVDTNQIMILADLIRCVSIKDKEGFAGFRLGVGINTPDHIPYFPYAKTSNDETSMSIALEMCLFLEELVQNNTRLGLNELRSKIEESIIRSLDPIQAYYEDFCLKNNIKFNGFDLSIAPFPYPLGETSVACLIQKIGSIGRNRSQKKFEFGNPGTLFVHTYLTNIIKNITKNSHIKTCGFNGIMYSLLEDNELSRLYEEDKIRISDLSMLSSTCGCGIDMVPLSCESGIEEIAGHIMDVYSLSKILCKPLGVRILVNQNARPGDVTNYKHVFLSNTRVKKSMQGLQILNLPHQIQNSSFKFKV